MGLLDKFKKGGGGFLNNVDGTIESIIFTTDRPVAKHPKPGQVKPKTSKVEILYARVGIAVDGVDELQETSLTAGDARDWKISKDGKTITPQDKNSQLWGGTGLSQLLDSMDKTGFPGLEDLFTDDEGFAMAITFKSLEGERFRFVQRRDEELTEKLGQRTDPKTGKRYDRTYLAVSRYYPEGNSASDTSVAVRGSTKKTNGGAEDDDEQDVAAVSAKVLKGILTASKKPVKYVDLKLAVTKACGEGSPYKAQRSEIREWLMDEDNLLAIDGVTYDQESKGRELSLD